MNSLPEIEAAIMQLSEGEIRDLSNWLQEYLNDAWDKQGKRISNPIDKRILKHHYDEINKQQESSTYNYYP